MKRIVALAVLAGALAVFANAQSIIGAKGFGLAGPSDSETIDSFFSFGVVSYTFRDQTRTYGAFAITIRGDQSFTQIYTFRVNDLTVDTEAGTATFSGEAYLVTRTRSGFERTRGFVVVEVEDNRRWRDTEGDPDTIRVAFYTDPEGDPDFTYEAVVKAGDIHIFSRTGWR